MSSIRPIKPERLPIRSLNYAKFDDLLTQAHFVLGKFEALTTSVQDPEAVFSLLIHEETLDTLHSQNVAYTLEELFSEIPEKRRRKHLKNYERAVRESLRRVKKGAISLSFILKIHHTFKEGLAIKEEVGRLRKKQNWIGPTGGSMSEAYYFPPKPQLVASCMKNLLSYLRSREKDKLVQVALFFAQLLVIHPFMDGNGRVARLLIPLLLYKKGLLSRPLFFMSHYFKVERVPYFEGIYDISAKRDWEGWIRFFLVGIIKQGERNCKLAQRLIEVHSRMREELNSLTDEKTAAKLAAYFLKHPVFTEDELLKKRIVSTIKMHNVLKVLKKQHLLKKKERWSVPPLFQIDASFQKKN